MENKLEDLSKEQLVELVQNLSEERNSLIEALSSKSLELTIKRLEQLLSIVDRADKLPDDIMKASIDGIRSIVVPKG